MNFFRTTDTTDTTFEKRAPGWLRYLASLVIAQYFIKELWIIVLSGIFTLAYLQKNCFVAVLMWRSQSELSSRELPIFGNVLALTLNHHKIANVLNLSLNLNHHKIGNKDFWITALSGIWTSTTTAHIFQ